MKLQGEKNVSPINLEITGLHSVALLYLFS